jgi:hypothetical protein
MNAAQKHAMRSRTINDPMTKDEAEHILNWYYGSSRIIVADGAGLSVGVVTAIEVLGGKYQSQWGVTRLPNYQPKDEI